MYKKFIKIAFLSSILGLCFSCQTTPERPNILFIAVDDLRPDLGCYGNSLVQSPNLDRLAQKSTLFTHHFVTVPTCGASRQSLLTGIRPLTKAYLRNDIIEKVLADKAEGDIPESFIHQLKRNGYYTVGIGKISHSADGLLYGYTATPSTKKELPHSWSELLFDAGKWKTGWNAFFGYADGENRQSLNKQVRPYEAAAVSDTSYVDGLTAQLAIKKLQALKTVRQPFFMGVGFFKPHLPFTAPQKYWDLYDRAEIPVAPHPQLPENVSLKSLHPSNEFNQYALGEEKASLDAAVSEAYAKKIRHAYFAAVSYVDAQIGLVLDALKALDLDKNTIVVVWGDHGWHLGDQQVWGKHTLFENALKSPLIIHLPGATTPRSITSITETVDLYPTLLELANVNFSHPIDGASLVPQLQGKKNTDEVAYSYYNNGISLRTQRYRLTKYWREASPTLELYDHETDPFETRNIAQEQAEIVAQLLPLLEKGNTGIYP